MEVDLHDPGQTIPPGRTKTDHSGWSTASKRSGRGQSPAPAAAETREPTIAEPPASLVAAVRADDPGRPAHPLQVIEAVRIGTEPSPELAHRPPVVLAGTRGGRSPIVLRVTG